MPLQATTANTILVTSLRAGSTGTPAHCAYRASVLYFTNDPDLGRDLHADLNADQHTDAKACVWLEDGLLVVRDGKIVSVGNYASVIADLDTSVPVQDYTGKLIVPGFIDTHLHYPQSEMIGSPAPGLLPWLEHFTFPTEQRFGDPAHAQEVAGFFLDELLRCGTTTAMVYCTVHPASVDAFFTESHARDLRMVAGKVLMDRHCPEALRDTAEGGIRDSEELIQRWHNRGRQQYAITPRFAPTSTPAQLQLAGELAARYSDTFIQTHVAENADEVAWVASLFPEARSYLDVYDGYGLMRRRAMYGHCIWLDGDDRRRMAETGAAMAVCPTSNLFLGSGLFDFDAAKAAGAMVSLATDVGGGTSFSMLATMNEAYKVARMKGRYLSGSQLFYMATLGGARSMDIDHLVGSFVPGKEADFIVLDPQATPLMARRTARVENYDELLFVLAMLGDDRTVAATYAHGVRVHQRAPS